MEKEQINNLDSNASSLLESFNRYMANRTKLDVNLVYQETKIKYPIVLTNTYALENGKEDWDEDFLILCGEYYAVKFFLYDNGLDFVFDVEKTDGSYTHWHPIDTESAIKDVTLFMEGICKI